METNIWTRLASMNVPRTKQACQIYGSGLTDSERIVTAGIFTVNWEITSSAEIYSVISDIWTDLQSIPGEAYTVVQSGPKLLMILETGQNKVYEYNINNDTWDEQTGFKKSGIENWKQGYALLVSEKQFKCNSYVCKN